MIGIRVDANEKIAMGHLMRCISIAKQLKALGEEIVFVISEAYAKPYIEECGYECVCLGNRYNEKESEVPALLNIIRRYSVSKLLLDSYEVTYKYMEALKAHCRLCYIDDLNLFCYPADMIINYTFKTDKKQYNGMGYKEERFLLGEAYVPLRPEFGQEPIAVKKKIESIFLTTGGTDEYNMIISILKELQSEPQLSVMKKNVVIGKFYRNLEELYRLAAEDGQIQIYHDIPDIWRVMRMSDIAISAGGTTLAELCACGLPTVCFAIAENQLPGTAAYSAEGLMLLAGNVMTERRQVIENVVCNVKMLAMDFNKRENMAGKARSVIDGRGAYRIAEEIAQLHVGNS